MNVECLSVPAHPFLDKEPISGLLLSLLLLLLIT